MDKLVLFDDFLDITDRSYLDPEFSHCVQAAHCMLYAELTKQVLNQYNPRAIILMQLRFDGHFGFPGGEIDEGETPVVAVNRELAEEVGLNQLKIVVGEEDLACIHYYKAKSLVLHFYTKKISLEEIKECEKLSLNAVEYGEEVMGIIRPTLYTMEDGYRGFPAFLNSPFIGNSKQQLIIGLKLKNIMSEKEVLLALKQAETKVI